MGAHIVKRRPPVSPPQPAALRQTAELTERQLHELIFDQAHDRVEHAPDDLEAELEFVDALSKVFPAGTPVSLPTAASLRFARTLRRDIGAAEHPASTAPAVPIALPTAPPPPMRSGSRPVHATPRSALPSIAAMQAPPASDVTSSEPPAVSDTATRSRLFGDGLSAGRALLTFVVLFLLTLGVLPVLLP